MNYIVLYVEGCSPKLRRFKSKQAAIKFANKHEKKNVDQYSDNWSDCIIEGEIIKAYPNWRDVHETGN